MTKGKDFKKLIRERMQRTGETYTVARSHFTESGEGSSVVEHFPIRMSRWFRALGGGRLTRDGAAAEVSDELVSVRFGDSFDVDIPLSSIRRAGPYRGRVTGWGVHGGKGVWLVNGSGKGVVTLEVDPPVMARMKSGELEGTVEVSELRLGLVDPARFLARVNSGSPTDAP